MFLLFIPQHFFQRFQKDLISSLFKWLQLLLPGQDLTLFLLRFLKRNSHKTKIAKTIISNPIFATIVCRNTVLPSYFDFDSLRKHGLSTKIRILFEKMIISSPSLFVHHRPVKKHSEYIFD